MTVWVSLGGMLRLIRVDTLRRGHNAGFIAGRLNYSLFFLLSNIKCSHILFQLFISRKIFRNLYIQIETIKVFS